MSQGLKYMGMGVFAKAMEKSGAELPATGGEPSTSGEPSTAPRQRRKSVVAEQEEEDDRHIRFTIGGIGRRMTKEDFIREMQTLDKPTRREVVERSDAPKGVKAIAKQDAQPQIVVSPPQAGAVNRQDHAPGAAGGSPAPPEQSGSSCTSSRNTSPGKSVSPKIPAPSEAAEAEDETDVERRRRVAALKGIQPLPGSTSGAGSGSGSASGSGSGSQTRGQFAAQARHHGDDEDQDDDDEHGETAAERRRREAALGIAPHADDGEDSDDDDTPRVPPSRRSIRFADVVERGRTRE